MNQQGFENYTYLTYGHKTGTANSYIQAVHILDRIFSIKDVFGLCGQTLTQIEDPILLHRIVEFISSEERKFKKGQQSIFTHGLPTQTSYPKQGFCSAALKHLQRYQVYESKVSIADSITESLNDGKAVSNELLQHFDITREGRNEEGIAKVRIGQAYYRKMILSLYSNKCCVTGVNIPTLLRASHIIGWAENKANRMNPENGLCLSGTYDLAFDQHLISFDEKYRMVIGKEIKDHFTNEFTKDHFERYEGKQIILPTKYLPNQKFLEVHRELLH